ncbi:MAG: tRNA pseudouridine(55) synthase TruB [Gammaproteobacteria bacterium]|nr:tRNA pseudouridine(55) synthase TruB [Gammaproteobacteria bacterium]
MAKRSKRGRPVNGVLLLDKPIGMTSNAALQTVKRLFQARKAGHTGSLDPLASGMLPLCFGEATKISSFLLEADKRYRVGMRLGIRTETGDAEGEISYRHEGPIEFSQAVIEETLAGFIGRIEQIPPMYSAVKVNGRPLYELARKGLDVERKARQVEIHELHLLGFDGVDLEIDVHCSKGTYIRTLVEAIGEALGCGAYVTVLRRPEVAGFAREEMLTLERLEAIAADGFEALDALLIDPAEVLSHWPAVSLNSDMAFFVTRGQPVQVPNAPRSGWVRLFAGEERFLGMGTILDDGRVAPKRMMQTG